MGWSASRYASVAEPELLHLGLHRELELNIGITNHMRTTAKKLGKLKLLSHAIRQDGKTALHLSTHDVPVLRLLLRNHADPAAVDSHGLTPLMSVLLEAEGSCVGEERRVSLATLEAVKALSKKGLPLETESPDGRTAMHIAAKLGDVRVIDTMLSSNANVNVAEFKFYRTPIQLAVKSHHNSVVHKLLTAHADPNLPDKLGRSAIIFAAECGDLAIMKTLLQTKGGVPPLVDMQDRLNDTALLKAVRYVNEEIACLLVEYSAQVNCCGPGGETALHFAVAAGLTKIARLLVDGSADLEIRGSDDHTPLLRALRCNAGPEIVEMLVLANADVDAQCGHDEATLDTCAPWAIWNSNRASGDPAVVLATKAGDCASLQALLQEEADPADADESGCTAFMAAAAWGRSDCLEVLLEQSSRLSAKRDEYGWPAQVHAAARGHIGAAELLDEVEIPKLSALQRSSTVTMFGNI